VRSSSRWAESSALNGAVKTMLFAGMPRYTEAPQLGPTVSRRTPGRAGVAYEAFVDELLGLGGVVEHQPQDGQVGRVHADAGVAWWVLRRGAGR
jgi:hypothetical protein